MFEGIWSQRKLDALYRHEKQRQLLGFLWFVFGYSFLVFTLGIAFALKFIQ